MSFSRTLLAVLACTALALPVSASLLEEATGGVVAYQFDGDSHHDAPDACSDAAATWSLPYGDSTDGLLLPPDDMTDSFILDLPASAVGRRLLVDVEELAGPNLAVLAYGPDCLGTVFDPLNLPVPPPAPPTPGPGEEQREADRLNDPHHCEPEGWYFWAERVGATPPASIHVAWTDGSERTVPLAYEPGDHGVYVSSDALGVTLKGAWINAPAGWDGRFELVAGPCDAVDGGAVYGEPPSLDDGLLAFTPVRAGPHVVLVVLPKSDRVGLAPLPCATCDVPLVGGAADAIGSAGELAGDYAAAVLADPTSPPALAVPASCHYCPPALEDSMKSISYRLRSTSA